MKKKNGTITSPLGFKAFGMACGIKKSGKKDLALIVSTSPSVVAGVFTKNQYQAAPIIVSKKNIKSGVCRAIIANSGNANCRCTDGAVKDAEKMVETAAKALNINVKHVLVTSTGSIGKPLPMKKIVSGIKTIAKKISEDGGHDAAEAILTTDTRTKEIAVKVDGYKIAGIAKGSGMIAPDMATMHAFITTDAQINLKLLKQILKKSVDSSFNMLTVDNCMSTNDCVFVLANGLSGVRIEDKVKTEKFSKALDFVCKYLASEIARDGEGATQLIRVIVKGARNLADARIAAKAIAGSDLLKCAVYGKDYNPGRIFAAVGATCAKINPHKMKVDMRFGEKETVIMCNLGSGKATAEAWGCDLTYGYVKINARYHT
ncbi:hypothetical protein A2230_06685 [candidate division WOR-1 bacterium RIFOXYA2_FULL_36_21]|uniref:Arginine biosynthesis bifunctional protein ArgJ n=1 Tax=candidate division WOR-1 bacterium RIFOXYB2_FULL_36_35 TaxID=1802578 RepID=A0A1F4S0U7_UNCSA|nr:MAG: hypothetical protein A2230_06685 [candidate division WOR-1 bacterium RIFOXYA2_FULL_36_21]OGC14030.1 MAG: hypothetical protein A2290_02440 [candidate division WOR-1 bacterium RIFOXYB2_FULL_36_35]OGC14965.1 MAG: hypothetical protein A2282_06975 [candidate division WOR-1 bacterium RIFOXYA12_FULL_36_13]